MKSQLNRKRYLLISAVLIFSAQLQVSVAFAIIFDQGPPPNNSPSVSSTFLVEQSADDFVVTSDQSVAAIRWWGNDFLDLGEPDNFVVGLFDADVGLPASDPFTELTGISVSESVTALVDDANFPIKQYDLGLATPLDLATGNYFISIVNEMTTDAWLWSMHGASGSSAFRVVDGDDWSASAGNLAFQLLESSSVPAPSTWSLIFAGMAGFWGTKYRPRRVVNGLSS